SDKWNVVIDRHAVGSTMQTYGIDAGNGKKDVTPVRQVLHEAILQIVSERQVNQYPIGNDYEDKLESLVSKVKKNPQFQDLERLSNPDPQKISDVLDSLGLAKLPLHTKSEQVMMVTGGPGTGKSGILEKLSQTKPEIYNTAAQINPDHYRNLLADFRELGAIHSTYTQDEASLVTDKIIKRIGDKMDMGGQAPHVVVDIASPTKARMEFAKKFEQMTAVAGTAPVDVTVQRAYDRGVENGEAVGRVTPTRVVLAGAAYTSKEMPNVFDHKNLDFKMVNADVPRGKQATLVAEWDNKTKSLNVYDHNRFIEFVERQNINTYAKSPTELFVDPKTGEKLKRSPSAIAPTLQPYLDKGITINFMTPDNRVAMSMNKGAIEINQGIVSERGNSERYFEGLAKETAKKQNIPVTENRPALTGRATSIGSGLGVGIGIYGLSQKLGDNGTAAGDLKDDKTRKLAQTGIATDIAAIGVDSAEGLATLNKVSKGLEGASRVSRVAAPVATVLTVASGVVEYKIAEQKGDGKRAAEAVGSSAGGLTGALAGGVAGAKGGAMAGAAVGSFFGGVGAVPGAAIGGFIGGLVGAVGGGWIGAEGGKAVSGAILTDTFQKQFDEQRPTKKSEQSRTASPLVREAANQPYCDYTYSPALSPSSPKAFAASAPDMGQHFKMAAFGGMDASNEAKFANTPIDYSHVGRQQSQVVNSKLGL
ncbi:MAG TPA: hypothetical protein DCM27_03810, partial [Rhodospirillaceae bacterium]|nr:hypothetical protein [Rhodospirillaceae bacterium]